MSHTRNDQAFALRGMMRPRGRATARRLAVVALSGAKGGVGATTVCLALSVALARRGVRAAVIDASRPSTLIAEAASGGAGGDMRDVCAGRASWRDVLREGPEGVLLAYDESRDAAASRGLAADALLAALDPLEDEVDAVVLDTGGGASAAAAELWAEADNALVVTTADTISVMDAYATIKQLSPAGQGPPFHVVINRAGERQARAVGARLDHTCERFLGTRSRGVIAAPNDVELLGSAMDARPAVVGESLVRALDRLAETLSHRASIGMASRYGRRGA